MLLYAEGDVRPILQAAPPFNRGATEALVARLFPGRELRPLGDGSLYDACPPDGVVLAACYPRLTIVSTSEVALDRPSTVDRRFLAEAGGRTTYLHAMHGASNWFAYAVWGGDGYLERALSLATQAGLIENVGQPLPFEKPYWRGERSLGERYPLPFHPLDLAEGTLRHLFGFNYDGKRHEDDPVLERVRLAAYQVVR